MHVPKPVIVAVLVVCGLVGVGVATAAVGPDDDERGTPSVATSEVTTSTTAASSTTEAPPTTAASSTTAVPDTTAPAAPADDDGGSSVARYYGPECGAEIPGGTHGDYVRRTADEGGDVPTMAQSNCGKPVTSVHDGPPAPEAPENEGGGGGDHPHGGPPGQAKDKPAKP